MMRRVLLYLAGARWMRNLVTQWGIARQAARHFIAGETLDEAVAVSRRLNARGMLVTLDYLGESVEHEADTRAVVASYQTLIERITAEKLNASVSVKLTHLGLDIRQELALDNLRAILTFAKARGVPVTIDMESSAYTERTISIFRQMLREFGPASVGAVIQSYLYRSAGDMEALAAEGAMVRLCKGAYLEPASVAFPDKDDVDQSYVSIMRDYLAAPPPAVLQMATHDEQIIAQAETLIRDRAIPPERYEFQMLYGIRTARQEALAAAGHPMRIYVPFGGAWYPYFMRRLAERPANVGFFLRNALGESRLPGLAASPGAAKDSMITETGEPTGTQTMDQHYRDWSEQMPRGLLLISAGVLVVGQAITLKARRRPLWQWLLVGLFGLIVLNVGVALFGEGIKHRTLYESKLGL